MKPNGSIPRAISFVLTLALFVPSSALALRINQEGAGLEELQRLLPAPPFYPPPAAGLEEDAGAEAAVPLNLKARPMLSHDYAQGGPVLDIEDRNPGPLPRWTTDQFRAYAQMENAMVLYDNGSNGGLRVLGFLVFEKRAPHEDDAIPEPARIEIRHLGVHPDYWESGQVEKELVNCLRSWHPDAPTIVMEVHERDRGTQEMLRRLGSTSTFLPNRFGDEGGYEFVLLDSDGGSPDLSRRTLDQEADQVWIQAQADEIPLKKAAVQVLQILEDVAVGTTGSFMNWRRTYNVLAWADDAFGLQGAVEFKLFTRKAMHLFQKGQDARGELSHRIERFREDFELSPSEYLKRLWHMENPEAGLEEKEAKELDERLRSWGDLDQRA